MTDKRTPTNCPHCGHDGAFGGLGRWPRDVTRVRAGVKTEIRQTWFHYHCPNCGNESAMLESEETVSVEDAAVAKP